ncbi:g680 [Coccomyxa viridis]|uniref:G680 protein n=1 Tax=Coccomyxa viridis TaxID=1274662 RepID=A0ABP1FJ84_9CHLO
MQEAAINRARAWVRAIPLATRAVAAVCVTLYLFDILTGWVDIASVCLSAHLLIDKLQVYRLLTSPFYHVGILHLAFNMLAFLPIGQSLERHMGTLHFTYLMWLLMTLGNAFYLGTSLGWDSVMMNRGAYSGSCAVGLSGLIFGLIVVDNLVSGLQQRSIFGFFTVPAKVYPWALLVFWQLLMPGVSFWGHLGGLMAGEAYVRGWLKALMPSQTLFQRVEGWAMLAPVKQYDCYISHNGSAAAMTLPTSYNASNPSDSSPAGPGMQQQGPGWMRSFGQQGRPGGQGATVFSGANGAGASAQAPGQSRSFLGSLGVATQPPQQTTFKGKAHTLGNAPTVPPPAAAAAAAAARAAREGQHGAAPAQAGEAGTAKQGISGKMPGAGESDAFGSGSKV